MSHVVFFLLYLKNPSRIRRNGAITQRHMTGLKKNAEYAAVYRRGRSTADRNLVLYALDNGAADSRFGISVSKKIGNSVVRHRIKRRLKEICRLGEASFAKGKDYVIIARKPASDSDYAALQKSLTGLMKNFM